MENKMEKTNIKIENRTLKTMRESNKKRSKYDRNKNNIPFTGMFIFKELVKGQNMELLNKIAEEMFTLESERENFIEKYMKINYQIPDIIDCKEEELNQDIFA